MSTTAFNWEAKTRGGEVRKGVMEADSEQAVANKLKLQMLMPVSIRKRPKEINLVIGSGVKTDDLVIFSRLFATMIDAGLPVVQCMEILSGQAENKYFGKILLQIKNAVEGGSSSRRRWPSIQKSSMTCTLT